MLPERMTEQRATAIEKIGERQGVVRELAEMGGVSGRGHSRARSRRARFEAVEVSTDGGFPEPDPDHAHVELTDAQASAAERLKAARLRA